MKKSQILMSLLLVILLSSCYASRITYENLSIIQRGMSSKEVIAIMGKPSYRSFDEESEMLEFRTSESSIAGVVNIWLVDDRVTKMKSYYTNGCMDRNRAIEDKEEEESAKKEKKEKEMLFHISRFWYLSLIKLGGFNINTKVVKMFEICKKGNTEW